MTDAAPKSEVEIIPISKWLSDTTLLLAAISALSYVILYIYELAYSDYFHIPSELVTVELVDLLKVAAFLMVPLVWVISQTSGFLNVVFFAPVKKKHYILICTILFAIILIYLIGDYIDPNDTISRFLIIPSDTIMYTLIIMLVIAAIYFPIKYRKNKKIEPAGSKTIMSVPLWKTVTQNMLVFITLLPVLFLVVPAFAGLSAKYGKIYSVLYEGTEKFVVIRKYGDLLVCAKIVKIVKDGKEHTLVNTPFIIIPIKESTRLYLATERIGKLEPLKTAPTEVMIITAQTPGATAPIYEEAQASIDGGQGENGGESDGQERGQDER